MTPRDRARAAVAAWWGERSPEELPDYAGLVAAVEEQIRTAIAQDRREALVDTTADEMLEALGTAASRRRLW